MYPHLPGKGKGGLALDAISHMPASTITFLDDSPAQSSSLPEAVRANIVAFLHDGLRLLTDA